MKLLYVAAVGTLGFATLACSESVEHVPTQPTVAAAEPRPEPPPQPPPDARRIELGTVTTDVLPNRDGLAGCPPLEAYPNSRMPCRHFEVVASGDGILHVGVVFTPNQGAEGVSLVVAGIAQDNRGNFYAPVGSHRVLAGATYGMTVIYDPSHYEYLFVGPDPIGEFTIRATIEPRTWR
jgi:hypothetical protein